MVIASSKVLPVAVTLGTHREKLATVVRAMVEFPIHLSGWLAGWPRTDSFHLSGPPSAAFVRKRAIGAVHACEAAPLSMLINVTRTTTG